MSKLFTVVGIESNLKFVFHILILQLHNVHPKTKVNEKSWQLIQGMAARRLAHEPVQYVIGDWDFRHLCLDMKSPVLIPRQETEVKYVMNNLKHSLCIHRKII